MIKIRKNRFEDIHSKLDLLKSTVTHIEDIHFLMTEVCLRLIDTARSHDSTKLSHLDQFYEDFKKAEDPKVDFKSLPWYKMHTTEERHHLNIAIPDDVDLFDVFERIVDLLVASKSRGKSFYPEVLDPEILHKAYLNTITKLQLIIEVKEDNE